MKNYKDLLEKYTDKMALAGHTIWMLDIWKAGKWNGATTSYFMVLVPLFDESVEERSKKISHLIPDKIPDPIFEIPTTVLSTALAGHPMVKEYVYDEVDCEACDASGEVKSEWTNPTSGSIHEFWVECPECDGLMSTVDPEDGVDIEWIYNDSFCIQIGRFLFRPQRVKDLLDVAEHMEVDKIEFLQEKGSSSLFRVGDALVVMGRNAQDGLKQIASSITEKGMVFLERVENEGT